MAESEETPSGKHSGLDLSKHLGPLELWQWGVIAAGLMFGISLFAKKKAPATQTTTTIPQSQPDIYGGGSGGALDSGYGSGGGYNFNYTPQTYTCPDGSIVTDPSQCPQTTPAPQGNPNPPPGTEQVLALWLASPLVPGPQGGPGLPVRQPSPQFETAYQNLTPAQRIAFDQWQENTSSGGGWWSIHANDVTTGNSLYQRFLAWSQQHPTTG